MTIARIDGSMTDIGGSTASGASTVILAAGTNVRGAILTTLSFSLNSTVATICSARVLTNGLVTVGILRAEVAAGAINTFNVQLPYPIFLTPGIGLTFENIVSPANIGWRGAIRIF